MKEQECDARCRILAEAIREAGAAGRLVGKGMLSARLEEKGFGVLGGQDGPDLEALLAMTLAVNEDLAAFPSHTGETLYHCPAVLSRTYASILDRKNSPILLIAEEVRRSSAESLRPVPVDLFGEAPFGLSPQEIQAALQSMAGSSEFGDVASVLTDAGAVYLFSTRHLEPAYAAFLAEEAETGPFMNP